MRIMIYIEPVTFRFDPLFLRPWIDWVAAMVRTQATVDARPHFALASSPWLCRIFETGCAGTEVSTFPIRPTDALRAFGMDRALYGQDLARPTQTDIVNRGLYELIDTIISDYEPDAIISFTQNRYIVAAATGILTLFTEVWPLPRSLGCDGFFLDPQGHQIESVLVTHAERISAIAESPALIEGALAFWDTMFTRRVINAPDTAALRDWLAKEAAGAPVVMLALQPPDWLTLEGLYDRVSLDGMLMRWLELAPPSWRAIATYHPSFRLSRGLESTIAEQMPNLMLLPEAWSQGRSEWLMPHVNAVATVSSAVGFTALLSGKPVVSFGNSNLTGFAHGELECLNSATHLSPQARMGLLAFLTHRYCHRADELLHQPGYIVDLITTLSKSNPTEYCLDCSDWTPKKAERLLAVSTGTGS